MHDHFTVSHVFLNFLDSSPAVVKFILHKFCGEPSLLVQCTPYKFGPGIIHTLKIAHRRTLLEGLLAAVSIKSMERFHL